MTLVSTAAKSSGTASGVVLISDSVLGADAASFDITGIVQTYIGLRFLLDARGTKAATSDSCLLRLNNDSGANYDYQVIAANATTVFGLEGLAQTSIFLGDIPAASATAGRSATIEAVIDNYTGTVFDKNVRAQVGLARATTTTNVFSESNYGLWRSTAAVTRITVFPASNNFLAGSRLTLWGLT